MSTERVAAAAVKLRGRVFEGTSHKEAVFAAARALNLSPMTIWAAVSRKGLGFTTSRGRFIGRAEAWVIAEREGQLLRKHVPAGTVPELHSEDLR